MNANMTKISIGAVEVLAKEVLREITAHDSIISVDINKDKICIQINNMQDFAEIQDFANYETQKTERFIHHRKTLGILEFVALEVRKGVTV